jgi:Yip1-like protein
MTFDTGIGVFVDPIETFKRLEQRPTWISAFLLAALLVAGSQVVFLGTELGWHLTVDRYVENVTSGGGTVSDQQIQRLYRAQRGQMLVSAVTGAVWFLLSQFLIVFAGHALFNGLSGQRVTRRQVLAMVASAALILGLGEVSLAALKYATGSLTVTTGIGVLVRPFLPTVGFFVHFLNAIDIFGVWWLTVISVGFANLYRWSLVKTLTCSALIYLLLAIARASIKAWVGASI